MSNNSIHPTAIVHKNAQLGNNVTVGANTIIGENVIIGDNTEIGAFTIVEGITTIGTNNYIGHHSVIGGKPQDMKYANEPTKLIIGNNNTIREFVTIHTGTVQDKSTTIVGSNNWIMSYVHLAHDCNLEDNIIISNNAQLAGHVQVQNHAIIGGMSGIHQFVRIGEHAMIGGASSLVQDVPPYVMAAGSKATPHGINSTGLSRRGFTNEVISKIKHVYKLVYRENLSFEEAKQAIDDYLFTIQPTDENEENNINHQTKQAILIFSNFIKSSERGIIR
jgi:UDP-N-acetylglucosamine acyltransferase